MPKKFFRNIFKKRKTETAIQEMQISEPTVVSAYAIGVQYNYELHSKVLKQDPLTAEDMFKILTGGRPSKLNCLREHGMQGDLDSIYETFLDFTGHFNTRIPNPEGADFIARAAENNASLVSDQRKVVDTLIEKAKQYEQLSQNKSLTQEQKTQAQQLYARCTNMAYYVMQQTPKITKIYEDIMTAHATKDTKKLDALSRQTYGELYSDTKVVVKSDQAKVLGAGGLNTVYEMEVDGTRQVFKRGHTHLTDASDDLQVLRERVEIDTSYQSMTELTDSTDYEFGERKVRIPSKSYTTLLRDGTRVDVVSASKKSEDMLRNANLAQRDVAVSRLNNILGLGAAVQAQLAQDRDGTYSSLMTFANGKSALSMTVTPVSEIRSIAEDQKEELASTLYLQEAAVAELEQRVKEAEPNKREGVLAEYRVANLLLSEAKKKTESSQILNVSDISLNRSLQNLAALDFLCGHGDRNFRNYMIEEIKASDGSATYQVSGIDNDMTFSHTKEALNPRFAVGLNAPIVSLEGNFPVMEESLRDKIMSLTPEILGNSMRGLLDETQIDVTKHKLALFQEHIRSGKVEIVTSLTQEHVERLQDPTKTKASLNASLFGYSVKQLESTIMKTVDSRTKTPSHVKGFIYNSLEASKILPYIVGDETKGIEPMTIEEKKQVLSLIKNPTSKKSVTTYLNTDDLLQLWTDVSADKSPITRAEIINNSNTKMKQELFARIPYEELKEEVTKLTETKGLNDSAKEAFAVVTKEKEETLAKQKPWVQARKPIEFESLVDRGASRPRFNIGERRSKTSPVKESDDLTK